MIILAVIVNEKEKLEEKDGTKVSDIKISTLESAPNNIGRIFNLNNLTVAMYLDKLQNMGYIKVIRTAGLDIVKINEELTFIEVDEIAFESGFRKFFFWATPVLLLAQAVVSVLLLLT